MNKKRAYISGAISRLPEKEWRKNFEEAEQKLRELGYENIVNPINVKPFRGKMDWVSYMKNDIRELVWCDEIYIMSNWIFSKGCWIEVILSLILGIKVRRFK